MICGNATSYLNDANMPEQRKSMVNKACRRIRYQIKKIGVTVDAVAVRGVSGLLIGTLVADKLGLPLVVVRKPGENTHSVKLTEGVYTVEDKKIHYIIIDDLISSGATVRDMQIDINRGGQQYVCVGIYLYADCGYHHEDEVSFHLVWNKKQLYDEKYDLYSYK